MAALTAAMLALTAAQTAQGVLGARRAAGAAKAQGNYAGAVDDRDAQFADQQAADALDRGNTAALRAGGRSAQLAGAQRAGYAAQGLNVNTGSAADVQADSRALGALDALTIQNNARREAWGYQVQGADYRARGQLARMAGSNEAAADNAKGISSLLTGGSQLASVYANRPQSADPAPAPGYSADPAGITAVQRARIK